MARRALNAAGEVNEAAFQVSVVGLLRVYGWPHIYHAPAGGHAPARTGGRRVALEQLPEGRGFPDLLAVRGPRILVAELKSDAGRIGPGQAEWLGALREVGLAIDRLGGSDDVADYEVSVEAYLWRPRDWDTLHDIIRGNLPRRRDLDPVNFG